jgi:hypothetical protein
MVLNTLRALRARIARNILRSLKMAATSNAPTLLTIKGSRKSTVVNSTINMSEK